MRTEWSSGEVWKRGLQVTAGENTPAEIVLNAGTLSLRFVGTQGGELVKTGFEILPSEGDESVLWSSDDEADVLLVAGRYNVHVWGEGYDTWERDIDVTAGQETAIEIVARKSGAVRDNRGGRIFVKGIPSGMPERSPPCSPPPPGWETISWQRASLERSLHSAKR